MSTYAKTSSGWSCDSCGAEMAIPLFCDGCGADYPERRAMSPFGILGLEQNFAVDEDHIDQLENRLATRLHPDRWQNRGESLHRKALLAQSAVNEALELVREPFQRAETLLEVLWGLPEQSEETRPRLPTAFLVQQLELQEEIESGLEPERKRELKAWVRKELSELLSCLSTDFTSLESHTEQTAPSELIERVQAAIDRSRYWRNIRRSLRSQRAS